eukprot:1044952_1
MAASSKSRFNDIYYSEWTAKQLEDLIFISEAAERWEDMCRFSKQLVIKKSETGHGGSNTDVWSRLDLLCRPYNIIIKTKLFSLRLLDKPLEYQIDLASLHKYKTHIKNEIETYCVEVMDLLTKHVCPIVELDKIEEASLLLHQGYYYRCLAEISTDKSYATLSENAYQKGLDIVAKLVKPSYPLRTRLVIDLSLLYVEIQGDIVKGITCCAKGYHLATTDPNYDWPESGYSPAQAVNIQEMRDMMKDWQSQHTQQRAMKLISGYIRNVCKTHTNITIPAEMNQVFVDYYFVDLDQCIKDIFQQK